MKLSNFCCIFMGRDIATVKVACHTESKVRDLSYMSEQIQIHNQVYEHE